MFVSQRNLFMMLIKEGLRLTDSKMTLMIVLNYVLEIGSVVDGENGHFEDKSLTIEVICVMKDGRGISQ